MDPVTHALSGVLLKETGKRNDLSWKLTLFCITSAMSPDIDFILMIFGKEFYMVHHRGITHSIIGAPVLCAIWTFIFSTVFRFKDFKTLFGLGLVAIATHILLDLSTSYGTFLLAPISSRKFALDFVFIVDLSFTGLIIAAILFCRKSSWDSRRVALVGFAVPAFYVIACGISREIALSGINKWAGARFDNVTTVAVLPKPFTMLNWAGVVETKEAYYLSYTNILSGNEPEWEVFQKTGSSPFLDASEKSEIVRKYLNFARFPVAYNKKEGSKNIVEYYDIRFRTRQTKERVPFILRLIFNDEMEIVWSGLVTGTPHYNGAYHSY